MELKVLVDISRELVDKHVKRSSGYFYKNIFDEYDPDTFATLLHKVHMILCLTIDENKRSSKYNLYNEFFVENLSNKIIEELYIKCLQNKKDLVENYIDYLSEMLKTFIKLNNDVLKNILIELSKDCHLFDKMNDILLENKYVNRSPIRNIHEMFIEDDNLETIKYYIYEKEIVKNDSENLIDMDSKYDIKNIFDFLNITTLYKSSHDGKKCLENRCKDDTDKLYGVIRYYNSDKDVSFKFLNTTHDFEYAKLLAKKYAIEEFGDNIVNNIIWPYVNINTRAQYTKMYDYKANVYAVIELPKELD